MKPAEFYTKADDVLWGFITGLPIRQIREVALLHGNGWTKCTMTCSAFTLIIILGGSGISFTSFTDLNPTVRTLDYYTYGKDDDHEFVIQSFGEFLKTLWDDSMAKVRHTRLFSVAWPKIPDFKKQ